jgi:hypothetical protein
VPNKRFLGLGFTFSATDRGLEKKLLGIQKALSGISSALDAVNDNAISASNSINRLSKPKSPLRKATPKTTKASEPAKRVLKKPGANGAGGEAKNWCDCPFALEKTQLRVLANSGKLLTAIRSGKGLVSGKRPGQSSEAAPEKKASDLLIGAYQDLKSRLNKDSTDFFEGLQKSVFDVYGKDIGRQFQKALNETKIAVDKNGKVIDRSIDKVMDLSDAFAKASADSHKFVKSFTKIQQAFEALKDYFGKVKAASDRFFQSIGVDFSRMIPEQFKAVYGVLDAVILSPIKKGLSAIGKSIFGRFKKTKTEDLQEKQLKVMGTSMSKNETLQAYLSRIADNTKPEKKAGIFDNLKSMISGPLGMVAGALSFLFETLVPIIAIGSAVVGLFEGLYEAISPNIGVFKDLFSHIVDFGAALGSYISGLFSKIIPDSWKKMFSDIADTISGWFKSVTSNVTSDIGQMFVGMFTDLIALLKQIVTDPFGAAKKIFYDSFKDLGKIIGDSMVDGAKFVDQKVVDATKGLKGPAKNTPIIDQSALGPMDQKNNVFDYRTGKPVQVSPIIQPGAMPSAYTPSGQMEMPAQREAQLKAINELGVTQKDSSSGIIAAIEAQSRIAEEQNAILSKIAMNGQKKMEVKVTSDKVGENTSAQLKLLNASM